MSLSLKTNLESTLMTVTARSDDGPVTGHRSSTRTSSGSAGLRSASAAVHRSRCASLPLAAEPRCPPWPSAHPLLRLFDGPCAEGLLLWVSESRCARQYVRVHYLAHSLRLLEQGTVRGLGERVEALQRGVQLLVVGLGQRVGDRVVVHAMKEVDRDLKSGHLLGQIRGQLRVPQPSAGEDLAAPHADLFTQRVLTALERP